MSVAGVWELLVGVLGAAEVLVSGTVAAQAWELAVLVAWEVVAQALRLAVAQAWELVE